MVDTVVRTPEESTDALNSQMAMFGVPTTAIFSEAPSDSSFSLAFQEGMRPLPWIEMVNHKKQPLKEVIVKFVYSKSGDGTIDAVSSETIYSDDKNDEEGFRVKYQWVASEEIDLQSGSIVMFLGVLIVSVMVLIQSCSGGGFDFSQRGDDGTDAQSTFDVYGQAQTSVASGMPKWD